MDIPVTRLLAAYGMGLDDSDYYKLHHYMRAPKFDLNKEINLELLKHWRDGFKAGMRHDKPISVILNIQ